jgi:RNA polymerase sigma factor (sigma-70 family)
MFNGSTGGDEAVLCAEHNERLIRTVRRAVRTTDENVEDACSFAWMQLMRYQPRRGPTLFAWLKTVAVREAIRLDRRDRRSTPVDDINEALFPSSDSPETQVEARDRLEAVTQLPDRQRRILALKAGGYSYREIADRTGDTIRTVERQLLRARQRIRTLAT